MEKQNMPKMSTKTEKTKYSISTLSVNPDECPNSAIDLNSSTNSYSNATTQVQNYVKNGYKIPSDILDDLASRFIINAPDMELNNLIRICFQIELAHWFYLDFFCTAESEVEERKIVPCGMRRFSTQIFQHIPFLRQHLSTLDQILEDWKHYKLSVPTYGAILISEDLKYCVLVQSYFAKSSWGFPKGKVNENEEPEHCAAREVLEETGYDITKSIDPANYIDAVVNFQYTRLYIVNNVSLNTQFSPRTRNEIKCCDWFPIDSLPTNKNDAISKAKLGMNANSFFMILPFVKRLKKWVQENGNGQIISSNPTSPLLSLKKTKQQFNNEADFKKAMKKFKKERHKSIDSFETIKTNGNGSKKISKSLFIPPESFLTLKSNLNDLTTENSTYNPHDLIVGVPKKQLDDVSFTKTSMQKQILITKNENNGESDAKKNISLSYMPKGCIQLLTECSECPLEWKDNTKKVDTISAIVSTIRLERRTDNGQANDSFQCRSVNHTSKYSGPKVSDILSWESSMNEIISNFNTPIKLHKNMKMEYLDQVNCPIDWDVLSEDCQKGKDNGQTRKKLEIKFRKFVSNSKVNQSTHIPIPHHIEFTPNCDTWKNFSFTKNFITNIFC